MPSDLQTSFSNLSFITESNCKSENNNTKMCQFCVISNTSNTHKRYPLTQWDFSSDGFPLLVLHTKSVNFFPLVVHSWEVVFESEWRVSSSFGSLRAKLILAPLDMPKRGLTLNELIYRTFFVQTSTWLPPSSHRTVTEHGRCCMQNNQLPTKIHVELLGNTPNLSSPCSWLKQSNKSLKRNRLERKEPFTYIIKSSKSTKIQRITYSILFRAFAP